VRRIEGVIFNLSLFARCGTVSGGGGGEEGRRRSEASEEWAALRASRPFFLTFPIAFRAQQTVAGPLGAPSRTGQRLAPVVNPVGLLSDLPEHTQD
jgi:hypothetical protein